MIGDRIHLSDDMLIALRRERAVLTAFPDGVPPNEHLARVLMREDRIAQVCVCGKRPLSGDARCIDFSTELLSL